VSKPPLRPKFAGPAIWTRCFPKFVFGFVLALLLVTWIASRYLMAGYNKLIKPEQVAPINTLRGAREQDRCVLQRPQK